MTDPSEIAVARQQAAATGERLLAAIEAKGYTVSTLDELLIRCSRYLAELSLSTGLDLDLAELATIRATVAELTRDAGTDRRFGDSVTIIGRLAGILQIVGPALRNVQQQYDRFKNLMPVALPHLAGLSDELRESANNCASVFTCIDLLQRISTFVTTTPGFRELATDLLDSAPDKADLLANAVTAALAYLEHFANQASRLSDDELSEFAAVAGDLPVVSAIPVAPSAHELAGRFGQHAAKKLQTAWSLEFDELLGADETATPGSRLADRLLRAATASNFSLDAQRAVHGIIQEAIRAQSRREGGSDTLVADRHFVGTNLQVDIYHALDGCALTKDRLAEKVCRGEGTRLYRPGGIKEMIAAGAVSHIPGLGYYRVDAPPPQMVIPIPTQQRTK